MTALRAFPKNMIGQTISHYRVLNKLGAGGMGEVYRATDSKLGRDVALKVLPTAFAQDTERMTRFQREAQVLASLNHPNIATIHGIEEDGGVRALVMELVEGPTLAERIVQDPLPLDEALPIARQIADALEYAHECGVIHRDLKPANVKLTSEGKVKILDFGLAKALTDDASAQDEAFSPTLSAVATKTGIILGTAAYMSPEQAKGKRADRRADIWAFGVLLYEMLTGRRLYTGETASETLAHVITKVPTLEALPGDTPQRIRRLLERCLTRDPKLRLQAIGEARIALEQVIAQPVEEFAGPETSGLAAQPAPPAPAWQRALPWAVATLAIVTAALSSWAPWRPTPLPAPSMRMSAEIGAPVSLALDRGPAVILSPDGTRLAFLAQDDKQKRQIYVRSIDQLQATPLAGTEGARDPFFSPDGKWIAFFADNKLKKIATQGGAAVTLCDATAPFGGSWGEDDSIVFTPDGRTPLFRVSSAGGKPEPLTTLDQSKGELTHRWPQVLPGGEAVLFSVQMPASLFFEGNMVVQSLKSGERRTVVEAGAYGRYVPSGHILYAHWGNLFAVPYDLDRMEVTGPPAPFLERVVSASLIGGAQYSFSSTGSFAYVTGESRASKSVVYWMDRAGKFQPLRSVPAAYVNPRISPDGKQLSLNVIEGGSADVWVYDWARDTMTRLTFDPGNDIAQVWTPDGQRIAFASNRGGAQNLYWQRADGAGEAQRLTESKNTQFAYSWTPDGKILAFHETDPVTSNDLWVLPMEGDEKSGWKPGTPKVFLKTPFNEGTPIFSPDGRWLAYQSNESGRSEVYVRPFPGGEGKWMISNGGGIQARWSRNAKELFYVRPEDHKIMVASYRVVGGSFQADKPVLCSPGQLADIGGRPNYDVTPDGKRFAVLRFPEGKENAEKNDKFVLILNVFEELRRRVPPPEKSNSPLTTDNFLPSLTCVEARPSMAASIAELRVGKKLGTIFALLFVLLVVYLLTWPVAVEPVAWTPAEAPQLTGDYAVNDKLAAAERIGAGVGVGPETVSVDAQGRIYGGYADGRIVRFAPDGSRPEIFAQTGGRPLGHRFDAAGNLIVADASKGLLSISPDGKITTLATQQGGVPFGLTDDVEPGADGNYYFSDASSKHSLAQVTLDFLEHGAHGRLLVYDPRTRETRLLLDKLHFANGVAVAPDASFVLVAETAEYRVRRYWLAGPRAGQSETFLDNLPGFPDGISSNGRGIFWLAIYGPRDAQLDGLLPRPFLRKLLLRLHLPDPAPRRYAMVLGLDAEGRVVHNLQDPSASAYAPVTAVQEHDGMLYLGSIKESSIARLPLAQSEAKGAR